MMRCVTFALLLLALDVGIATVHGNSLRSKRQTELTCNEETETKIATRYLFTETQTCSDLVGQVDDWYNLDYRNECHHWLKTNDVPDTVSKTYVSECFQLGNGTVKYRTDLCCHGKPNVNSDDQLVCFTCDRELTHREPNMKYYHSQHCNYYGSGTKICAPGEVCAVELYYNATYQYYTPLVSKSCKPSTECAALEDDNGEYCKDRVDARCAYCYSSTYGNYEHPIPYIRAQDYVPPTYDTPCERRPCRNGGTCINRGTEPTDYECLCREGYSGTQCQTSQCSYAPCKNGGYCSTQSTSPYYICRYCRLPWTGYNCTESTPLCSTNWCLNGGTCYVLGESDERCLCPTGYVGKSCEYKRPMDCGENSALRLYSRSWTYYGQHDCTYLNDVEVQRYLNSYASNCYSHLKNTFNTGRPVYKPGIHGEGGPHQAIGLQSCEPGKDRTTGRLEICCASCGSNPCLNGGWCIQDDRSEGFICRCRFNYAGKYCQNKLSSCYAAGDPHYYTFDGVRISYQGSCKYVLTENLKADDLPYFRVTTKNEHREGSPQSVTYPKYAEVEVYGVVVRLGKDNQAYVNGELITPLPYVDPTGHNGLTIFLNGLHLRLETDFGLVVEFANNWLIIVRLPGEASGNVDGICRDYDDDPNNDYVLNGVDVTDEEERDLFVGNYFEIPDPEDENCVSPEGQPPTCDDDQRAVAESTDFCGYIEDTNGPFAQCISSAADGVVETNMENCVYDVCVVYEKGAEARKSAACSGLAVFAEICKSEAAPPSQNWREITGCVPECPGDLIYKASAKACRPTCARPSYPEQCSLPNTENCVCPDDKQVVMANNTCGNASDCGCYEEGLKIGEVWYNSDCSAKYECVTCTDCPRPVGKVVSTPYNPCDSLTCNGEDVCEIDVEGDTCTASCASKNVCDPKWTGPDCEAPKTYDCEDSSPCTRENIEYYPDNILMYFAHDDPTKFIQCVPNTLQCFVHTCPPPLVFDNEKNVCDWP